MLQCLSQSQTLPEKNIKRIPNSIAFNINSQIQARLLTPTAKMFLSRHFLAALEKS